MNVAASVLQALMQKDADDAADSWFRSQTRRERRRLLMRQGNHRGFFGKGKIPRVRND